MISVRTCQSVIALLGLSLLGCAGLVPDLPRADPPAVAPAHVFPEPGCPYTNVYVAVSANDSVDDARLAARVQAAYSDHLVSQGFRIVDAPEEAYWRAFSMVNLRRGVDATFAWTVYMMATQDVYGVVQAPSNFAGEADEGRELSGFILLRDIPTSDLQLQTRAAALETAGALGPHAIRMCEAWLKRENEDPAITELREKLKRKMQRVRCQRTKKRVTVEWGEPAGL